MQTLTARTALWPAPAKLQSRRFRRAMAGLAERCCPDAGDRVRAQPRLLFRVPDPLGPEGIETIAAFARAEAAITDVRAAHRGAVIRRLPDRL